MSFQKTCVSIFFGTPCIIIGCRIFINFLSEWAIYISSFVISQFLLFGFLLLMIMKVLFVLQTLTLCVLHMLAHTFFQSVCLLSFILFMVIFIIKTLLVLPKFSVYLGWGGRRGVTSRFGVLLVSSAQKKTKIIFVLF